MDRNDQQAIAALFERLRAAEAGAPPRDAAAERFINERIANQPAAPYFMAQTIVVLEGALAEAKSRAEALEAEGRGGQSRGFLGGLFGSGDSRAERPAPSGHAMPRVPPRRPSPFQSSPFAPSGGGFLAGAAQTAMGVAGGVLLGNAIGGMFGADAADAAETPPDEPTEEPASGAGGEEDFGDFEL